MIVILSITLFILAILHYLYDSLLTPSLRFSIRFELFELRDNLRNLKINDNENLNDEVFGIVDNSINSLINYLPDYHLFNFIKLHKYVESNAEIRDEHVKRAKMIRDCKSSDLKEISKSISLISYKVLFINSAPFFVYLSPFIIAGGIVLVVSNFADKCKSWFKNLVEDINLASELEIEKNITSNSQRLAFSI